MYKDRKIYLCSFGNLDLYPSAIRLKKQAESFNIFDEIFIYNEYNLPYDEKFERAFRSKLIPSRGFGYWCWKPFILLKTLESMNNNDILLEKIKDYCPICDEEHKLEKRKRKSKINFNDQSNK